MEMEWPESGEKSKKAPISWRAGKELPPGHLRGLLGAPPSLCNLLRDTAGGNSCR
jgi:hypothetical protein